MTDHTPHVSDESLLRAIDHEWSPRERPAIERHLEECERCRARRQAIEALLAGGARAYRDESPADAPVPERLRARLRASLTDLSNQLDRSWRFRLAVRLAAMPAAAIAGLAVVAAVLLVAVWQTRDAPAVPGHASVSVEPGALPVRSLTPGATGRVTVNELCAGPVPEELPIPTPVRQAVLRDYRMENVPEDEYELDYLITPALGGATDQRNLWPERYGSRVWNARVKDDLERLLPTLVCRGQVGLSTAQQDIASNWIRAYQKYFHTDRPVLMRADGGLDEGIDLGRRLGLRAPSTKAPGWLD